MHSRLRRRYQETLSSPWTPSEPSSCTASPRVHPPVWLHSFLVDIPIWTIIQRIPNNGKQGNQGVAFCDVYSSQRSTSEFEATIAKSYVRAANFRGVLGRVSNSDALKNCKTILQEFLDPQPRGTLTMDIRQFESISVEDGVSEFHNQARDSESGRTLASVRRNCLKPLVYCSARSWVFKSLPPGAWKVLLKPRLRASHTPSNQSTLAMPVFSETDRKWVSSSSEDCGDSSSGAGNCHVSLISPGTASASLQSLFCLPRVPNEHLGCQSQPIICDPVSTDGLSFCRIVHITERFSSDICHLTLPRG